MTPDDLATALQFVRDALMHAAGEPSQRSAACGALDALAMAVVVGALPGGEGSP